MTGATPDPVLPGHRSLPVALCFVATGAAGLVYEVVWSRVLALQMGNTAQSLAVLLSVFMGGLALGAWLGSRLASATARPLRLYGRLELGLGAYCLALPLLIDAATPLFGLAYRSLLGVPLAYVAVQAVILGGLLLVPTTLMGATLPVLVRHLVRRDARVGGGVGLLYALNSGGAAGGALLAGYVILPRFGVSATMAVAIAINLTVGLICVLLARGVPPLSPLRVATTVAERLTGAEWVVVMGFAVSGAAAMVYQVAWTRALALAIGSYTYAFTAITAAFILGLTVGSAALGWLGDRRGARLVLAALPVAIGVTAAWTVGAIADLPVHMTRSIVAAESFGARAAAEFGAVFGIVLWPTFCMGGLLPVVVRVLARSCAGAARALGSAYAANTIGAIVGAAACGFVLIPWLGMRMSILLGAVLSGAVGAVFAAQVARPRGVVVGALAAVAALALPTIAAVAAPSWERSVLTSGPFFQARWLAAEGGGTAEAIRRRMQSVPLLFYREDAVAVVTVTRDVTDDQLRLHVGGKSEAVARNATQAWLGHLSLLLRPAARSALVVGLGSGQTLAAVAAHRQLEAIDCVEISPAVVDAVRTCFQDAHGGVLDDPRVQMLIGDGRAHLEHSRSGYDVVVSQPGNPWLAGAAGLFTREAFEAMRRRLAPGGLACTWCQGVSMPLASFRAVCASWAAAFPYASVWAARIGGDYLLLGSEGPLAVDHAQITDALRRPALGSALAALGLPTVAHFMGYLVTDRDGMRRACAGATPNEDDTMRVEFDAPRELWRDDKLPIFDMLHAARVDPWQYVQAPQAAGSQAFAADAARSADILRAQQQLHEAMHFTGPDRAARAERVFEDVLRRNPHDALAREGLAIVRGTWR